jgi:hypothetical protein
MIVALTKINNVFFQRFKVSFKNFSRWLKVKPFFLLAFNAIIASINPFVAKEGLGAVM